LPSDEFSFLDEGMRFTHPIKSTIIISSDTTQVFPLAITLLLGLSHFHGFSKVSFRLKILFRTSIPIDSSKSWCISQQALSLLLGSQTRIRFPTTIRVKEMEKQCKVYWPFMVSNTLLLQLMYQPFERGLQHSIPLRDYHSFLTLYAWFPFTTNT
jgi:hypothetical protein